MPMGQLPQEHVEGAVLQVVFVLVVSKLECWVTKYLERKLIPLLST